MFISSDIKFNVHYDYIEQVVRVTWHVKILSNVAILGNLLCVDGISKYHINWEGKVFRHEVINILVNDVPQTTPYLNYFDMRRFF